MIIGEEKEKQLLKKWKCLFGKLLTVEKRSTGQNGPVDRNLKIYTLCIFVHVTGQTRQNRSTADFQPVDRFWPVCTINVHIYIYIYMYIYIERR